MEKGKRKRRFYFMRTLSELSEDAIIINLRKVPDVDFFFHISIQLDDQVKEKLPVEMKERILKELTKRKNQNIQRHLERRGKD